MLSDKAPDDSALQMLKDDFKRKMQKDVKKSRHSKHKCKSKAQWSEEDYDAYVQTVRRHGKNYEKMQEALNNKTKHQIKRFTKALCKQIESASTHPELDLLDVLMDASSDEETDGMSILKLERERKKKERTKRNMLSSALLVPESAPNTASNHRANPESIDSLERLIK